MGNGEEGGGTGARCLGRWLWAALPLGVTSLRRGTGPCLGLTALGFLPRGPVFGLPASRSQPWCPGWDGSLPQAPSPGVLALGSQLWGHGLRVPSPGSHPRGPSLGVPAPGSLPLGPVFGLPAPGSWPWGPSLRVPAPGSQPWGPQVRIPSPAQGLSESGCIHRQMDLSACKDLWMKITLHLSVYFYFAAVQGLCRGGSAR